MSKTSETTRRSFLKTGAITAAPLAAVGVPVAALAAGDGQARLARLEDERAIGELHDTLLRRINTDGASRAGDLFLGGKAPDLGRNVRTVSPDHSAEPRPLAFSADGMRASRHQAVTIEIAQELEGDGTLIQMARLQGNTLAPTVQRGTLAANYVRTGRGWAIESITLA